MRQTLSGNRMQDQNYAALKAMEGQILKEAIVELRQNLLHCLENHWGLTEQSMTRATVLRTRAYERQEDFSVSQHIREG